MRRIVLAALLCGVVFAGEIVFSREGEPRRVLERSSAGSRNAPGVVVVPEANGGDVALYCARFLQRAGYCVLVLPPCEAPYPAPVEEVERAIRFTRHQAGRLGVDSRRIALLGIGPGGLAASLCGVRKSGPLAGPRDRADRESAGVRAVVALAAYSDLRNEKPAGWLSGFLQKYAEQNGMEAALRDASPVMHITGDEPPFFLIHGDADEVTPMLQSTHLQQALKAANVHCDLLLVRDGGHDVRTWTSQPRWESELIEWLDTVLERKVK